eukprot:COSAG02_NODE_1328_length_13219_cov_45.612652_18_plen_74_part_00
MKYYEQLHGRIGPPQRLTSENETPPNMRNHSNIEYRLGLRESGRRPQVDAGWDSPVATTEYDSQYTLSSQPPT